nr:CoA transferase [Gammaproteobacteria bacterium]
DIGRVVAMSPPIQGQSRAFWPLNRNKRSLVIDLKHATGQAVAHELISDVDVVIHNFRPSAERQLRLDYETLSAINPRLIQVSFNAFGREGGRSEARGYDLLVQAAAGVSSRRPNPDGSPQTLSIFAIDMSSSMTVSYAVALALFEREKTGRGKHICGSLLQTALALQTPQMVSVAQFEEPENPIDYSQLATYQAYQCADHIYFQLAIANDSEWRNVCKAMSLDNDDRFNTPENRLLNSDALQAMFATAFRSKNAAHWQTRFDQLDAPGVVVESAQSVFESGQLEANDMLSTIEQPDIGTVTMVNTPFSANNEPERAPSPAPALGEHTDSVLTEFGFSCARIARLRRDRIIA